MAKRARSNRGLQSNKQRQKTRPSKNPLTDITLGQSFAEYDPCLKNRDAYVNTPALKAAAGPNSDLCFFVGRRGTGKTATSLFLYTAGKHVMQLLPVQLVPDNLHGFKTADFRDTRDRPFKSLLAATKVALLREICRHWLGNNIVGRQLLTSVLSRDINAIEQRSFDDDLLTSFDEILACLHKQQTKEWLSKIKHHNNILDALGQSGSLPSTTTVLIDRIDEAWDGSDKAVIFLMALMHACVELNASEPKLCRVILFLRENIFERVRRIDNEFSRLETAVVSLDWTQEQLCELVERRINLNRITKTQLGGPTWDSIFSKVDGRSSIHFVTEFCQFRPRDVLTYCSLAIDVANGRQSTAVEVTDMLAARSRFSDSRLKDIGDEYAENYSHINLVLARFYGLGKKYTLSGIASFIQLLLIDKEIQTQCSWVNQFSTPNDFADLLYRVSFFGISDREGRPFEFRSAGAKSGATPTIRETSLFMIHPCFHDALHLHDDTIARLSDSHELRVQGIIDDLPEGVSLSSYREELVQLRDRLQSLPKGKEHARDFEDIVGSILRLCFFKSLSNIQSQVRNSTGSQIRDWICSNTAANGFWEMIRMRYSATQVVWECKNYDKLEAGDFQQCSYYMNNGLGRCVVVAFRGRPSSSNETHVHNVIRDRDGILLLIGEKDLMVFLRQAINGKNRESHLQDLYDRTVRQV